MHLNTLWFLILSLLLAGFFFLQAFDYGICMQIPFLAQDEKEREKLLQYIKPFWDNNEIWLLIIGGIIFAAFPYGYNVVTTAFALPLFLLVVCLFARSGSLILRKIRAETDWKRYCDWTLISTSFLTSFLWGWIVGNLLHGLPINAQQQYVGDFASLFQPTALLCGCAFVAIFNLYGSAFLALKATEPLQQRAEAYAQKLWLPTMILIALFSAISYLLLLAPDARPFNSPQDLFPIFWGASLVAAGWFILTHHSGWAFMMLGVTVILTACSITLGFYPQVILSSLNPTWSLTVASAASDAYSLRTISMLTLILIPMIIGYRLWSFWVARPGYLKETQHGQS